MERLEDKIQRLLRLQDEILAGINDLPNKRYGKILTYRYVVGMTWDEIADSLDISPRWARRLCQRAELRYYKGGN
jgi:DNA-directed RNA polymerase specialized sigma24 family protein